MHHGWYMKGTLQGQNWESLNDYMQILGITFLRVINNNDDQRLLIGSENDGLYYLIIKDLL